MQQAEVTLHTAAAILTWSFRRPLHPRTNMAVNRKLILTTIMLYAGIEISSDEADGKKIEVQIPKTRMFES